jgi:hypothetical protein
LVSSGHGPFVNGIEAVEVIVSGRQITNDMPTMLGAATEGLGLAQVPAPVAAGAVKAAKPVRGLEPFAPWRRCVSLLSRQPANDAEAARLHRSHEEPFTRHTACQNETSRQLEPLKVLERVKGIEPSYSAWKSGNTVVFSAAVLTFSVMLAH